MGASRVTRFAASALILALVSAACGAQGGGASPTPAAAAATSAGASASTAASVAPGGPTVHGVAFPKPEKTALSICESAVSTGSMPIYYIREKKLDEMFGLKVTYRQFQGNGPCAQALAAGQVDVAQLSGQSLTFQLTDTPTVDTFVIDNNVTYILVCQKNITNAATLKGKSIAVSSFGSYSYATALLDLKLLGLQKSDVTLQAVGGHSNRLAALKGGSVGCDAEDHTQKAPLLKEGYNVLVDLSEHKGQVPGYVGLALEMPLSFIDKYPNTALALTAMYMLGTAEWLNADSATAAQVWSKYSTIALERAKQDIADQREVGWGPANGRCDNDTYAFMKTVLQETDARLASVDPAKACTNRFVDQLEKMGFPKAIKLPAK